MNSAPSRSSSEISANTHAELFQIVYVSAAAVPFSSKDLVTLLERSRAKNTENAITGLLFFHDGNFMQVLEGPEANVRQAYQRISQDPRHRGCIVLIQQPVPERTFGDWAMGFRDSRSAEVRLPEGYRDYLNPGAPLPRDASRAWQLLSSFKQSLR